MSTQPALSPSERAALGKAARKRVPRSTAAAWEPPAKRRSPVRTLAAQDKTRLKPLVPVRYGRMLTSAFSFYRGAAAIMAADLGAAPASGLEVQLCGDAHLSNFGVFEAPDRELVFDINDFDETLPGPFEWDVQRLAASLAIGGRDRGFRRRERRAAVLAAVSTYRDAMRRFAGMREVDIWYSRLDTKRFLRQWQAQITSPASLKRLQAAAKKARHKDSLRALAKLTVGSGEDLRIASRPPLLIPIEEFAAGHKPEAANAAARGVLDEYRRTLAHHNRCLIDRYRYVHAAHKVVGVGSVGTRAWIALLLGRDDRDPLFLQVKEAQASVLEPFCGRSRYRNHGHRVVSGQQQMQAAGDVLLGWLTAEGLDGRRRNFYVRQLWDGKGSAEIETMDPKGMAFYGQLCGWSLARAHARSGDSIAIAAYLGKGDAFDKAIAEFAELYADRNEADYETLIDAEKAGKLAVERGA